MGHRVKIVGDVIHDQYLTGTVGMANEAGLKIGKCSRQNEEGGAVFVAKAVSAFSGLPYDLVAKSYTTITRFRNETSREVLLTFESNTTETVTGIDLRGYVHDAIVFWDDSRSSRVEAWINEAASLKPDGICIVDSVNIPRWDMSTVNYIKMTYGDWDGSKTKHSKLILTSAIEVIVWDPSNETWTCFPVDYIDPVDVIGAGDVFTSVLVTLLLEGWLERDAIQEAIYYASQSILIEGCAVPVRNETKTPKVRNSGPIN